MNLTVKALPVSEIIHHLAQHFQIPIEEDCGELMIHIPENLGEGFIRGVSYDTGIGHIEYSLNLVVDLELHFVLNKTHPLKFIFCSKGGVEHAFETDENRHIINTYQNIIVSSSGSNGHVLFFKANQPTHVFSLEIIREVFLQNQNCDFRGMNSVLSKIFKDSVAQEQFFYQGNYSIRAADIVEEIHSLETNGFVRSLFLQAKIYEMLAVQISQYHDDQRTDKLPQILRRTDVEKVKKAMEIIESDLGKNISVDLLAKEVGTNVNKLQEGFKYLFKLTVNKYIQQTKLEKAKEMLASSEYNISQVVNLIGLNNRSYFAKVFKEKYGVSPSYFMASKKEKEEEDTSSNNS